MRIVTIAEHGIGSRGFQTVLKDLKPNGNALFVMLGAADIIEVSTSTDLSSAFTPTRASVGHRFRRASAAIGRGDRIDDWLKPNEARPVRAMVYVRLPPALLANASGGMDRSLRQRVLDWLECTLPARVKDIDLVTLLGMDQADFTLCVSTLSLDRLSDLLGTLRSIKIQDLALSASGLTPLSDAKWNASSLFYRTSTMVGLQLTDGGLVTGDQSRPIGARAAFLAQLRHGAGTSLPANRLYRDLLKLFTAEPTRGARQLRLLGHYDSFALLPPIDKTRDKQSVGARLTIQHLQAVLVRLSKAPSAVGSITSLAIKPPVSLRGATHLTSAWVRQIAKLRRTQLRIRSRTWSRAARRAGLSDLLTEAVQTLLTASVEAIEEGGEMVSLLPSIDWLTRWADAYGSRKAKKASMMPGIDAYRLTDAHRVYRLMAEQASGRARRDSPFHPPTVHLPLEGHAGYRLARDAFEAFLHDALGALRAECQDIMLIDSPAATLSTFAHHDGLAIVITSAVTLHHCWMWLGAVHEIVEVLSPPSESAPGWPPADGFPAIPSAGGRVEGCQLRQAAMDAVALVTFCGPVTEGWPGWRVYAAFIAGVVANSGGRGLRRPRSRHEWSERATYVATFLGRVDGEQMALQIMSDLAPLLSRTSDRGPLPQKPTLEEERRVDMWVHARVNAIDHQPLSTMHSYLREVLPLLGTAPFTWSPTEGGTHFHLRSGPHLAESVRMAYLRRTVQALLFFDERARLLFACRVSRLLPRSGSEPVDAGTLAPEPGSNRTRPLAAPRGRRAAGSGQHPPVAEARTDRDAYADPQ